MHGSTQVQCGVCFILFNKQLIGYVAFLLQIGKRIGAQAVIQTLIASMASVFAIQVTLEAAVFAKVRDRSEFVD